MRNGSRELVYLQEVDLGERPAILRRYLECASGARSAHSGRPPFAGQGAREYC
jgi:hypothetical protein